MSVCVGGGRDLVAWPRQRTAVPLWLKIIIMSIGSIGRSINAYSWSIIATGCINEHKWSPY